MAKSNLVIIGSGIEALILAGSALQKGLSVAILDSESKLGGSLAPLDFQGSHIDSLYSSIPNSEDNLQAINILNNYLPYFEPIQIFQQDRVTFEKGQFEPFVGFGDNPPQAVDLISPFVTNEKIKTRLNIAQLVQRLGAEAEVHLNCSFTDILVYDKKVASITIDGKKKFEADHFIFTKHPLELVEILPPNTLLPKTVSKLAPKQSWAYLNLLCVSEKPVASTSSCYILYGTQKNPIVGIGEFKEVLNSQNQPISYSQWITFLDQDTQDVSEDSVSALKEMKRQIKRAFPNAFDGLIFEKIALFENAKASIELATKQFGKLSELENLLLCSHHLISDTHIFAASLKAASESLPVFDELLKASRAPESNAPDAQL